MAEQNSADTKAKNTINCELKFDSLKEPIVPVMHPMKLQQEVPLGSLTVGQNINLVCKAESLNIVPTSFRIQWPEKTPENIKKFVLVEPVLVRNSASEIEIQTTSYLAGNFKLRFQIMGDVSGKIWEVNPIDLKVQSVRAYVPKEGFVDPNAKKSAPAQLAEGGEQGLNQVLQPTQPNAFPSMSQFKLDYPWYLWGIVGFLLLVVAGLALSVFTYKKRKKDFIQRWQEMKSPIGSHKDFHKSLRTQERKWFSEEVSNEGYLSQLYSEIRLFFFREYKLDNEKNEHKHLITYFSKNKNTTRSRINRLAILLDGIRDGAQNNNLKQEDIKDYTKRARELVDHLYLKGGL